MKNVYKVAFEKNFGPTNLLFFISSITNDTSIIKGFKIIKNKIWK